MRFDLFDMRRYPTLSVSKGYAAWAPTYDAVMRRTPIDEPLLDRIRGVPLRKVKQAVDVGCGTGRIGRWLRARGVGAVDGIDQSGPMLAVAKRSKAYRRLRRATVMRSGFPSNGYDLAISSLVACHLPDLRPFYREMRRLVAGNGIAIVVDFHPHFLLNGIPTHFPSRDATPLAIRNEVHLLSDHLRAAGAAGWRLEHLDEFLVPRAWLESHAGWARHLHHPVSFLASWRVDRRV